MKHRMSLKIFSWAVIALLGICFACTLVYAAKKPNIVVIWGDDVGYWNVSAYNQGMMGYETPNIDSVPAFSPLECRVHPTVSVRRA